MTTPGPSTEQLAGKRHPTQFGRALEQLGITFIAAHSPQAKGRVERLWGVLQDRLSSELRLAQSLRHRLGQCRPDSLYRRLQPPLRPHVRGKPQPPGAPPRKISTASAASFIERMVSNDNVVQWEGRRFQIPPASPPLQLRRRQRSISTRRSMDASLSTTAKLDLEHTHGSAEGDIFMLLLG